MDDLKEPYWASEATAHELFDAVVGNGRPETWMRAAHELEDRAVRLDLIENMAAQVVHEWDAVRDTIPHPYLNYAIGNLREAIRYD